ncbi:MAG: hypothetical protein V4725_06170 [Bacteroidota bacterium]
MKTTSKAKIIRSRKEVSVPKDPNSFLKKLIWLYILLWIFEGALRKWVVPALSMPLLVVRDPIVLWLLVLTAQRKLIPGSIYYGGMVFLGFLSLLTAIMIGHGDLYVAIYGARTMILYFPMIFVIGYVFNVEDVKKVGKWLLIISIPMTVILFLQFYSPQSAWINRGVGGDEDGAGFGGALGYFRPPGTFSFTNGTTYFYSLVAPFIVYFWLNPKSINKRILLLATGALMIAIPLSISRALFLQVAVTVIFLVFAISNKPKYFARTVMAIVLVVVALFAFQGVGSFRTATEAFSSRFEGANESEGGLVEGVLGERFLGKLVKAVTGSGESVFGYGVGSGTPLGAKLLKTDIISSAADFEWIREIGELGLMGLLVIALRVGLAVKLTVMSFRALKADNLLPWLLTSVGSIVVLQGQWHQPTALGFCALVGGLWLGSLRRPRKLKPKNINLKKSPAAVLQVQDTDTLSATPTT